MINFGTSNTTPVAIVMLNGARISWVSIQVVNKNYYLSDTYTIVSPLYENQNFGLEFWGNLQSAEVQIYMGYPPFIGELFHNYTTTDLELVFTGLIDNIHIDPANGSVEFTGRDYAALL